MKTIKFILLLGFLHLTGILFSQSYYFKTYSLDEGLVQSQVLSICQDQDGYLWLGTFGGLSRFDGIEFRNFSINDGLSSNLIYKVICDQSGNIWIATLGGGVNVFTGDSMVVFDENKGLIDNSIFDVYEDSRGDIWVSTGKGLSKIIYDQSNLESRKIQNYSEKNGLHSNQYYGVYEDSNENIWVSTLNNGVCKFSLNESKLDTNTIRNITEEDGLISNITYCVVGDSKGNIWIGTQIGASMYDGKQFTNYTSKEGLNGNLVWSIYEDNTNTIWISTLDGSLNYIKNGKLNYLSTEDGVGSRSMYAVFQDTEENLWFATDGDGLTRFSGKRFTNVTSTYGLANHPIFSINVDDKNNAWIGGYDVGLYKYRLDERKEAKKIEVGETKIITSLLTDHKGDLWIGTYGLGLMQMRDDKIVQVFSAQRGLKSNQIWAVDQDQNGIIWVGSNFGVYSFNPDEFADVTKGPLDLDKFKSYTHENGLTNNEVRTIMADRNNNIWIGIYESGLHKLENDSMTVYTKEDGLSSNNAESLCEDYKGNIWIGTYGGGVNLLDPKTDEIILFSKKDGLMDDAVTQVLIDKKDQLWIGTNRGISRLDLRNYYETGEKRFKNYGKEEGFFAIECNPNAICEDQDGGIWFGTIMGAFRYDPEFDRVNKVEPMLHITGIRLFFESFNYEKYCSILDQKKLPVDLTLPYGENHLTFEFKGISLTIPEQVKYQYKLEGLDEDWSPPRHERSATYSNVPPGEYTFHVKACNNDGLWNTESAKLVFTITPPFWQTAWFYMLSVVVGIGGIFAFVKLRERKLKEEKKRLEGMVDERTLELKTEKEKVEEINIELEKLSIVASETDNAILIADANGVLDWANNAFTRMSGYTLEEFKKAKGNTLTEVSANSKIAELIRESKVSKKSVVYEAINLSKEGKQFWAQSTLTPILDENNNLKKLVVIDTDVTVRKLAEMELDKKNKKIAESINYAQRIQETIMPTIKGIRRVFPESFIFFKPRDIVSGDFPFFMEVGDDVFIAVVDCTGHGVPGAIMSIIGYFLLNDIISTKKVYQTHEILNELHKGVLSTLKQEEGSNVGDGMEVALCKINKSKLEVEFAGANRPLIMVHNGKAVEMKGDKIPIGGTHYSRNGREVKFYSQTFNVSKGDSIFIYSDGLPEQLGGRGKRARSFGGDQILEIISQNTTNPISDLEQVFDSRFEDWRGKERQLDDLLMIGIKF